MKCPVCPDTTLLMTHRQGVEIDYCPQCRGVWLDRGELDKLIQLEGTHDKSDTRLTGPTGHRAPPQDFVDSDFGSHRSGH